MGPFSGLSPRCFGKLRTNVTLRRLVPLFGISKSAADRVINRLAPLLALRPRRRFCKVAVLLVDGTLVPTRDHAVAEQSKNYLLATATTARHGSCPERRQLSAASR